MNLRDEDKARITQQVIRVLNKNHKISEKRNVLNSYNRLNFACPYCGDSAVDNKKKRGNLYWDNLFYHCYNCSEHKSLDVFLTDFDEQFDISYRSNILDYIRENKKNFNSGETLDFFLFDKANEISLDRETFKKKLKLKEIFKSNEKSYLYLKSRFLHLQLNRFLYDPLREDLFILNFTKGGKIIGFQKRSLINKGPKYKTFNIERIYNILDTEFPCEEYKDELNKMSTIYGLFFIDFSRPFTVFEGPIDSFFMQNSIGLTGVRKKILDFKDNPNVRYFFDNDLEGKRSMIDKLKSGSSVFLWDKLKSDFKIKQKDIKDLNDLVIYDYKYKKGIIKKLNNYFSNDIMDILYI